MASFLETPRFPDDLAVWARGGISYNTTITSSTSGRERRNSLWSYGLGQWDLQNCFRTAGGVADPLSVQTLRNFFRVAKGQAYGFRFRDWTDYTDEGNGTFGAPVSSYSQFTAPSGTGSGVATYQMYKQYVMNPLSDYRIIGKPLTATIFRNGVACVVGTAAGQVTIDKTTGLVTWAADSSASISAWTAGATTSFTVATVPAGWAVGKTLYFNGVSGDTNSVVNNKTAVISAISGTTVTVSANTTGETLTSGQASMYPQPTDTLSWTGTFDTPVRFSTDQFAPQLDVGSGALYGFQTLTIKEIRL